MPAKARLRSFDTQERYGLIWVALEPPRWPLPEVPELEDGGWAVVPAGPYRWECDAGRQVENFTDFGHFQDRVVVESQRPERVPFDLAAELHLKFDAVAVAYRKAMRSLGLAATGPAGDE